MTAPEITNKIKEIQDFFEIYKVRGNDTEYKQIYKKLDDLLARLKATA